MDMRDEGVGLSNGNVDEDVDDRCVEAPMLEGGGETLRRCSRSG
jgi:hypothetical protein